MSTELSAELLALHTALDRFEQHRSREALDQAFAAAGPAISALRGARASEPAGSGEARELLAQLPDLERLVAASVAEADVAVQAAVAQLWSWFGLPSSPPGWNEDERAGARVLMACACAPLQTRGAAWVAPRLLRLAASRWAGLLAGELREADEATWERVLGGRYASVRQRYALRTPRRTRDLADLVQADEATFDALRRRLARWLTDGPDFDTLALELEAAFVETRTPGRLA